MPLAICVQHKLESEKKAETLRLLLDAIAEVTYSDEFDNQAYCWFRKSSDSVLEGTWIGGFELYNNEDALTVVHRASSEYQSMRKASAEGELWGQIYPEIIFLEPWSPLGFLNKRTGSPVLFKKAQSAFGVLTKYTLNSMNKDLLYLRLSDVAELLQTESEVSSYLPLVRKDGQGSSVIVFEQYQSKEAYGSVLSRLDALRSLLDDTAWEATVTTWSDGIGHIRGSELVEPLTLHPEARASL